MAKRKFKSLVEMFSGPGSAKRWTQWAGARNIAGSEVDACSEEATCWCLLGAIDHCYPPSKQLRIQITLEAAIRRDPLFRDRLGGIIEIDEANDYHKTTIRDIRRVVRKAGV